MTRENQTVTTIFAQAKNTMRKHTHMFRLMMTFLTFALVSASLLGCVRRRMTIRSNPAGATVSLDNKEIGKTPLTADFTHYGNRKFRLVKDGFETKEVILPVKAPWYEWPGLDFVSEVLLPGQLKDHKYYEIDMQPQRIIPQSELLGEADEMRRLTHSGRATRLTDPLELPTQPEVYGGSISPPPPLLPSTPTATPYQEPQTPTSYPVSPQSFPAPQPLPAPVTPYLPNAPSPSQPYPPAYQVPQPY